MTQKASWNYDPDFCDMCGAPTSSNRFAIRNLCKRCFVDADNSRQRANDSLQKQQKVKIYVHPDGDFPKAVVEALTQRQWYCRSLQKDYKFEYEILRDYTYSSLKILVHPQNVFANFSDGMNFLSAMNIRNFGLNSEYYSVFTEVPNQDVGLKIYVPYVKPQVHVPQVSIPKQKKEKRKVRMTTSKDSATTALAEGALHQR